MTKAAVFDLDGVLLDSMGIWNDLGARYLRSLGVTPEEGLNEILFSMSMEQGRVSAHALCTAAVCRRGRRGHCGHAAGLLFL